MTADEPAALSRDGLDAAMLLVLLNIAVCSHVPAAGYQPRSSSGKGGHRDLSGGDTGATYFAVLYGPPFHECTPGCRHRTKPATNDERRAQVLKLAEDELKALRGHGLAKVPRPAGETEAELLQRIREQGEGWTVREAAVHFRCGEKLVLRARRTGGRELDLGHLPTTDAPEDLERRRARTHELRRKGHSYRSIALMLRVDKKTVQRDLGKQSAA